MDVPRFAEATVEMERLVPQERVQWIDEQKEVPVPQIAEEIGEETVDFPELRKKFFELFTDREACLAALYELSL